MKKIHLIALAFCSLALSFSSHAQQTPIQTFDAAKAALLNHVYYDNLTTLYCGCSFERRGRSGGVVDHASCGYEIDGRRGDSEVRAARIEFEHIVPISVATQGRACGSRTQCTQTDEQYRQIKADPFNLSPSIGEVNAIRSNYSFAELPHINYDEGFGACNFKYDEHQRLIEPAHNVKGFIARTYFYMSWAYGMPLSPQEQRLFATWDAHHPVSEWERTRHDRIAHLQGITNPYVTGERTWRSLKSEFTASTGMYGDGRYRITYEQPIEINIPTQPPFVGNRNSKIYFPLGCHMYDRLGDANRVPFQSEHEAQSAGYRAARNC